MHLFFPESVCQVIFTLTRCVVSVVTITYNECTETRTDDNRLCFYFVCLFVYRLEESGCHYRDRYFDCPSSVFWTHDQNRDGERSIHMKPFCEIERPGQRRWFFIDLPWTLLSLDSFRTEIRNGRFTRHGVKGGDILPFLWSFTKKLLIYVNTFTSWIV